MPLNYTQIRRYLLYLGLGLTIIGLSFSKAMISIGQVVLAVVFLFDLQLINKLRNFFKQTANFLIVISYLFTVFSLFYSSDLEFGFEEIRTKIPLLLFPLVFGTEKKFSLREWTWLLSVFVLSVLLSLFYSLFLSFLYPQADFREVFVFVSHIRLGLAALLSLFILIFYYYRIDSLPTEFQKIRKILLLLAVLLITLIIVLEMLSALVILVLMLGIGFGYFFAQNRKFGLLLLISVFAISGFVGLKTYQYINDYYDVTSMDCSKLDSLSAQGNPYEVPASNDLIENGSYTGIYIQWAELEKSWQGRSSMDFNGLDADNQQLKHTLVRYLNSKKLRKDAGGIAQLSDLDIKNVELGIANVEYVGGLGYKKRLYKLLWEYELFKTGREVAGHSFLQRIQLWKSGIEIFKENPFFGVGTGGILQAYKTKFEHKTMLRSLVGLKSHNQYLFFMISTGLVGVLLFLVSILAPLWWLKKETRFFLWPFLGIIMMSMIWEDTLETMAGATLFGVFYSFFYFHYPVKK